MPYKEPTRTSHTWPYRFQRLRKSLIPNCQRVARAAIASSYDKQLLVFLLQLAHHDFWTKSRGISNAFKDLQSQRCIWVKVRNGIASSCDTGLKFGGTGQGLGNLCCSRKMPKCIVGRCELFRPWICGKIIHEAGLLLCWDRDRAGCCSPLDAWYLRIFCITFLLRSHRQAR